MRSYAELWGTAVENGRYEILEQMHCIRQCDKPCSMRAHPTTSGRNRPLPGYPGSLGH